LKINTLDKLNEKEIELKKNSKPYFTTKIEEDPIQSSIMNEKKKKKNIISKPYLK
jgi:hypothetical protein